eukprot:gene20993-3607_t
MPIQCFQCGQQVCGHCSSSLTPNSDNDGGNVSRGGDDGGGGDSNVSSTSNPTPTPSLAQAQSPSATTETI